MKETMPGLAPGSCAAALHYVRELLLADLEQRPEPELPSEPELEQLAGAFVSLHKAGHLRGCMGWLEADQPLKAVLRHVARNAAFDDPRFPALRLEELAQCAVEITVLEPARPVTGPEEIRLGRHGVILAACGRRAVFLPQVAPEQGWTLEETLTQLARKAGLAADAWRREDCRLEVFEAQVLREESADPRPGC
jgi:AmmeMemoRadiSam system protein A